MASILKVDTIQDQDGNNIINESANTITIGASGDTITIPSGATLANSGIVTGFQSTGIDDNATSTAITINSSNNVGIGTASPAEELTIRASVPKIQIEDSDGTNQYGQFYHSAGITAIQARNNTNDGTIVFQKYDGTTTDETMRIDSSGNVGIGTSSLVGTFNIETSNNNHIYLKGTTGEAYGLWVADDGNRLNIGSWTGHETIRFDSTNQNMQFRTGTGSEAMRIDSSGNVGINTTSPSSKLEVIGDIRAPRTSTSGETRTLLIGGARNGGNNQYANIDFQNYDSSGTSTDFIGARISGREDGSDDTSLSFYTANNTILSEAMTIDSSGNLQFNSGYGSVETAYGVRVWLRYDQVNNVVEASGGVSSVTDLTTGEYRINFTNTMPDADYALGGWSGRNGNPIVCGGGNDHNVDNIEINTGSINGSGNFVQADVDDTTIIIVK